MKVHKAGSQITFTSIIELFSREDAKTAKLYFEKKIAFAGIFESGKVFSGRAFSYLLMIFVLVLGSQLLISCDKLPGAKIPEGKFVNYYIDLVTAQDTLGKDVPATEKILVSLDTKYSVTREQYDKTLKYYNENPEKWELFYDKVTAELQKRKLQN